MRNLFLTSLVTLLCASNLSLAQTAINYNSIFSDDFSSSTGWFYTNGCPGTMAISGGTLNFTSLQDGACDERMEKLLPVLPGLYEPTQTQTDQLWMMEFDFTPTDFSTALGPGHMLMAVSQDVGPNLPSPQHPIDYTGPSTLGYSNIDVIGVYIVNVSANNQTDVRLGIFAKDGTINSYASQGVGVTTPVGSIFPSYQPNGVPVSLNNTYRVTLVRRYATLILSVRQGGILVGQRVMVIPAGVNIDNFDRIQSGNLPQGANSRWLSCNIDNLKFSRMMKDVIAGAGNTCLSYFNAGNLLNLSVPSNAAATYSWTGATQQPIPNQNVAQFPPAGGTYAAGINYPISCTINFSTSPQMKVVTRSNVTVMSGCKEGIFDNNFQEKPLIYPNPTQHTLHIEGNSETSIRKISLWDLAGKKVFDNEVEIINGLSNIILSDLAIGTYIIRITDDGKEYTDKIVISD